jgi:hypothetical protein
LRSVEGCEREEERAGLPGHSLLFTPSHNNCSRPIQVYSHYKMNKADLLRHRWVTNISSRGSTTPDEFKTSLDSRNHIMVKRCPFPAKNLWCLINHRISSMRVSNYTLLSQLLVKNNALALRFMKLVSLNINS